ncbi:DUF2243 domain-containing protein [Virgibacillus oceani]
MADNSRVIHTSARNQSSYIKRNWWSGFLFGLGMIAFIDETVFHQLLQWHHFYDRSTTEIGLISDGLFHAFSWFATIGGLFMLADLRRRQALNWLYWWGSVLVGAGLFQLYDGLIQHKVLRVHQVRYVENIWLYDLVWNAAGALLLITGLIIIRRVRRRMKG